MNTPQQEAVAKNIIKIKNRILRSSDCDEIAALIQDAIDISSPVLANSELDTLDKTKTKEWNLISVKRLAAAVKARSFISLETAYPEIAASLLKLSMVFVQGGLEELNKILAESLLNNGIFQTDKKIARS